MSRPSDLWQRKRDGFWMTTINGVQHKLSENKTDARKMLNKLLASDEPAPKKAGLSTGKLCDNYLVRTRDRRGEQAQEGRAAHRKAFGAESGHRDPATLKVHEVETWIDGHDSWSQPTRGLFIMTLKSVINWALGQQYLTANPP